MEKLVTILNQLPLQERQYTDRNGQNQVFASRGFVMSDGIDTFYAEATGDMARSLPQFDVNTLHAVQCQMSSREFKAADGSTRYQTEIRIVKIS